MFDIPIYTQELEIADIIRSSSSICHIAQIKEIETFEVPEKLLASLQKSPERTNFDLHYIQSLLVSSVWNENDDYMIVPELWMARNTAKDKQFNYEHNEDDIIGHTVAGYVVDDVGKIVPDTTALDKVPDLMHVISHAVLYKHWNNKDKQERMDQILAEIRENKWFVSVECLFPNFDYALRDQAGKVRLVARNEKTSFLTKHLKVYKGSGVYQNEKVARVPRNLIISGKGLVKEPANKQSIIFAKRFEFSKNNIQMVYEIKEEVTNMSKEIELQEANVKLQAELTQLKASLDNKEYLTKIETLTKNLEVATKDVSAKDQEIIALKASCEKVNSEKFEVAKTVDEVQKLLAEKTKTLNELEATSKYNKRLEACSTKLKMDATQAKLFVDNLYLLDDGSFEKHVDFQSQFVAKASVQTTVKTEVIPDPKALETIEKTKQATLAVNVQDTNKLVASKLNEFVANSVAHRVVEPKFKK